MSVEAGIHFSFSCGECKVNWDIWYVSRVVLRVLLCSLGFFQEFIHEDLVGLWVMGYELGPFSEWVRFCLPFVSRLASYRKDGRPW